MLGFITIRFLDIIDILLVAFLIYELYLLIKGTAAFNIFLGIFIFYIVWILVRALNMELMGNILGQVMAVGVLALIVIFQQEIRRVFLMIGTRYNLGGRFSIDKLFQKDTSKSITETKIREIVAACESLGKTNTGALIVLTNKAELKEYADTGVKIDSEISEPLLENIFFKNSPLHDGAVIIQNERILAARCVLPVTNRKLKNEQLGLRHRAAVGMTQATDAAVIIVSEETGRLSYAFNGKLKEGLGHIELVQMLEKQLES